MTEDSIQLKPLQVEGVPDSVKLVDGVFTLGRDRSNQIVLSSDDYPQVSAYHAQIRVTGATIEIEDLEAKNGTYVNGVTVERATLKLGDVIQLGPHGPRFLVASTSDVRSTITMARPTIPTSPSPSSAGQVRASVERVHAAERRILFLLLFIIIAVGGTFYFAFREYDRDQSASLAHLAQLLGGLEEEQQNRYQNWNEEKAALEQLNQRLSAQLASLESTTRESGRASEETLATLRTELVDTRERLARYNPVNLEKSLNEKILRVYEAVVFIETQVFFVDKESGQKLHYDKTAKSDEQFNLSGNGILISYDGSGSGFVISPEGHIMTNAHVAAPKELQKTFPFRDKTLGTQIVIDVLFSHDTKRHKATLVQADSEEGHDLALIKIPPFEGMAHTTFDPEVAQPDPGSQVVILGFPLGRNVVLEGEIITASMFKGILSRVVHPFLQVDAAVHPGNSGGPLLDREARIVGVVTAVQRAPDGSLATNIGYAVQISDAKRIWPPKPQG